jgi:hypothetical protein
LDDKETPDSLQAKTCQKTPELSPTLLKLDQTMTTINGPVFSCCRLSIFDVKTPDLASKMESLQQENTGPLIVVIVWSSLSKVGDNSGVF